MSLSQSGGSGTGGWTPPSVLELHQLLPQYEIDAILGHGGMGAVYKGRQEALGRTVAIKVLPETLIADDGDHNYVERFKLEARAMANLDHPAIISVHDFGQTDVGHLYFVMEFIDGMDIQQYIAACGGSVDPEHAIAIVSHVLDALDYAHSKGIIHRDIKPANVLINSEGRVKIADFGLAKEFSTDGDDEASMGGLTMTDMAMGTPDYIAPEALEDGVTADARADLYAVGVMLYVMLTGRLPRGIFKLPSEENSNLDPRFDDIITRALENRPDDRYANASEFRAKLGTLLSQPVTRIEAHQDTLAVSPPARQLNFGDAATQAQAREKPAAKAAAVPAKKKVKAKAAKPGKAKPPWLLIGVAAACVLVAGVAFLLTRSSDGPDSVANSGSDTVAPADLTTEKAPASGALPTSTSEIASESVDETEWPTGPNYRSEGKFRAWSSIPNDPVIDLSRLHGVDDLKQIYLHHNGWIVLRENGETISHDGLVNRTEIRKICAGGGSQFALITNSGSVEGVNRAGTQKLDNKTRAIDCFYTEPVTAISFEDGSLHIEGKVFDGIDKGGIQQWKEKPSLPLGRKATSISATPYNLAAQLDDGTFRVWTNTDGLIELSGYLDEAKLKSFIVNGPALYGIPMEGGAALEFRLDQRKRSVMPGGRASAIFPATNGFFVIHENGRVTLSGNFRDTAPATLKVLNQIGSVSPGEVYFSLKTDRSDQHSRVIWFDGESTAELTNDPSIEPKESSSGRVDGLVANGEWQDVLGAVSDSPFFSKGEWKSNGSTLTGTNGTDDANAVRGIETEQLDAFEARVRFSAKPEMGIEGSDSSGVAIFIPNRENGMAIFTWPGAIQLRLGLQPDARSNAARPKDSIAHFGAEIDDGELHEFHVNVTREKIRVSFDGEERLSYAPLDWTKWNQFFAYGRDKPPIIGVRIENGTATVHSFEIRIPEAGTADTTPVPTSPPTPEANPRTVVIPDVPGLQSRLANYRQARKQQLDALIAGYRSLLNQKKGADAAQKLLKPYATQIDAVLAAESIQPLPSAPEVTSSPTAEFTKLYKTFIGQLAAADTELQVKLDQSLQALVSELNRADNTADVQTMSKFRDTLKRNFSDQDSSAP